MKKREYKSLLSSISTERLISLFSGTSFKDVMSYYEYYMSNVHLFYVYINRRRHNPWGLSLNIIEIEKRRATDNTINDLMPHYLDCKFLSRKHFKGVSVFQIVLVHRYLESLIQHGEMSFTQLYLQTHRNALTGHTTNITKSKNHVLKENYFYSVFMQMISNKLIVCVRQVEEEPGLLDIYDITQDGKKYFNIYDTVREKLFAFCLLKSKFDFEIDGFNVSKD